MQLKIIRKGKVVDLIPMFVYSVIEVPIKPMPIWIGWGSLNPSTSVFE